MQANKSYSLKLTTFMQGFRKFLYSKKLNSPQQLFQNLNFAKVGWISKLEFQKFVQYSQTGSITFNVFDIIEMFKQMDEGWQQIQIKKFIQVYNFITSKILFLPTIINNSTQDDKIRKQQENKRKNNLIKLGFKKLQTFVLQHDAMALFDECDQSMDGKLNINQFNKLLIRTQIKQFQNKEIRRFVLVQIYSYFPSKQISRQDYIKFFKIPKEKIEKKQPFKFYIPPQKVLPFQGPIKPQIKNQPQNVTFQEKKFIINPQKKQIPKPPQNKNKTTVQKNEGFMKKKNPVYEQQKKPIVRLAESQQFANQVNQAHKIFPRAITYYRHGLPTSEQLPYFQELQNLLAKNKKYKDPKNPITSKGRYYQVDNFFNGGRYFLFEMAQSVLQREKSRIGLAQEIEPKDIIQGQIGDCYFLSSIASLISIYPEVISQKFLFNENQSNYFVTKLFIDGQWKYIPTDNAFPSQSGKTALFARPHGKQIWVMLLEKCWAKCFQSYQAIVSGSPKQGFVALTGAPTQFFSFKSKQITKQIVQNKIKQAFSQRHVVTASGSEYLQSLSQKQQQKIGLIGSHAYSFLKFFNLDGLNLVKVRNPWGTRVWKGDWSFESNKWTKSLRDKLNYHRFPDDGSFYMSMNDFLKYFGSFVICKLNPLHMNSSLKMQFKKHKSNYVKMKVNETGKYMISLYQESQRKMLTKYSNYRYSPARIIVMRKDNWEYIDSYQNSQSYSASLEVNLQEGRQYIISAKVAWKFWDSHQACLTAYGPQKVIFEHYKNQVAPTFKKQLISSFFKKNRGKTKSYDNIGAIGAYSEYSFSIQKGIGYYFITNPSQKKFQLTYNITQWQGLKVIKPDHLPFKFDLSQGSKYLKGFFTSSQGFSYSSQQSMSYY